MKKIGLLVLVMLGFAQVGSTAQVKGPADYSKMSENELNEALIIAVKKGSFDEVQKLVQVGANVDQKITYTKSNYDDYDSVITCTLLEYAAKHGYIGIVKELIQAKDKAAKRGYVDILKELIRGKAKSDDVDAALILAVKEGHADIVKELVKAGANVNHVDRWGDTSLILAVKEGHVGVVRELIKAGAHVNHADKWGDTSLILAARNGYLLSLKELIKAKPRLIMLITKEIRLLYKL